MTVHTLCKTRIFDRVARLENADTLDPTSSHSKSNNPNNHPTSRPISTQQTLIRLLSLPKPSFLCITHNRHLHRPFVPATSAIDGPPPDKCSMLTQIVICVTSGHVSFVSDNATAPAARTWQAQITTTPMGTQPKTPSGRSAPPVPSKT